ncbi:unnamed protein product [Rhizoctonia solani]|nr:unnamed protein product [Rhizoctonia solani]
MSAHPALTMALLCSVGGITGFVRTRSVPSLVAGVGVGAMYGYAGNQIRTGGNYGYETALAASVILFLSSAPRARKGPVPLTLTIAGAVAAAYYAKVVYDFRSAGVTMVLLFALINKVAGVYGLVSLFFGGSAAQISMYIYSSLAIVALAWGLKAVTDEDPKRTFYFAHIFVADHLLGTIWTVFFAVLWWVYNPHDGEKVVNSAAQEAMAGAHGNTTMTHEERVAAAQLIWNEEKGLAAAVLIAGWVSKIYFSALIYSYAIHLRQGSYRTLPLTTALANSISNNGDTTLMESDLESDGEAEGSALYRMPVRTPRTGDSFAEFTNAPSRGRKPGASRGSKLGESMDPNEEEVLWDEEEERAGASGMSSKLETESDLSSSTDPEAQARPLHVR